MFGFFEAIPMPTWVVLVFLVIALFLLAMIFGECFYDSSNDRDSDIKDFYQFLKIKYGITEKKESILIKKYLDQKKLDKKYDMLEQDVENFRRNLY